MSDDWYKRDVRAAIKGMLKLTLEERGAYNTLIDHQYLMGEPLPDDDAYLAGLMGCDIRVWRRVKRALLDKGRIQTSGGRIEDLRASCELASRQAQRSKRAMAGQLGGIASGKSRKTADSNEAHASSASNQRREEKKRTEDADASSVERPKGPRAISPDWVPKPETVTRLTGEGFSRQQINTARVEMIDWAIGNGKRKHNWDATLCNWVRKNAKPMGQFAGATGPPANDRQSRIQAAFRTTRADFEPGHDRQAAGDRGEGLEGASRDARAVGR